MPFSYALKAKEHTSTEKYRGYEETVVRVVPSGSAVGTDCRRSSRGVDVADSPCREFLIQTNANTTAFREG